MKYFRPRNWGKWQDCRFKNADWIKNWPALLDDVDYHQLTLIQRAVLHGLWLAWGRVGRPLPWDCSYLGRLLACDCNSLGKALPALEANGFIELCERTSPLFDKQSTATKPPEIETETEIQTPSESSAPSAPEAPPDDLKSRVFGAGLDWLAKQSGKKPQALRSQLGRWCRDYGDGPTLEAMIAGQRASPVEPIGYIERLLKSGGPRGSPHSEARKAALEDQVDQMISRAAEEADAQQSQANHRPVGEAQLGLRPANGEDHQRPAEREVRRAGGGLRGIASALPTMGTGGRH